MTKRDLMILALLARGYQAHRYDPMRDVEEVYSISPQAARRLADNAVRVTFTSHTTLIEGREARGLRIKRSMPKAMRADLALEGESLCKKPVKSLEDLGL